MKGAITRLAQLKDPDLFKEVSEGVGHAMEFVDELDAAAGQLLQGRNPKLSATSLVFGTRPAKALQNLAEEEAAKVLILLDAVRCPQQKDRCALLRYFNDHLAKGIYAKSCSWMPLDFKDVAQYVEQHRRAYYLDGPNDMDWICPNAIILSHEAALYIDYVCDDEEDRAADCYWTFPTKALLTFFTSPVAKIARALHQVGATTAEGLAVIAEVWRRVDVRSDMGFDELERLNRHTLEVLREQGLLATAPEEVYTHVTRSWPFPLWPLDLGLLPRDYQERKAIKEKLRRAQRAWSPEY
jgi:hypothetical protein